MTRKIHSWTSFVGKSCCKVKEKVCHTMALPFTSKGILRQKKKIMKNQIFHHPKI